MNFHIKDPETGSSQKIFVPTEDKEELPSVGRGDNIEIRRAAHDSARMICVLGTDSGRKMVREQPGAHTTKEEAEDKVMADKVTAAVVVMVAVPSGYSSGNNLGYNSTDFTRFVRSPNRNTAMVLIVFC
ncbi:hypothetical protein BGZ51_003440 [Haplosporangium sp. Z 767]|nr:hypothetical protein BGZ50_001876 [Haplosporangium sp. Z 11]KAF9193389.1 hypothetical protein BGZ51_003440 [Haplosporangium sp. Z 767]